MGDWIHYIIFIGGVILVLCLCVASFQTSMKLHRWKATKLAEDLDMELLASDNPNMLVVAGEIHNRPTSIRYKKEKSSLDHIRSGFTKTLIVEAQEIIINVECECGIHFKISTSSTTASDQTDYIPNALLASSGLHLQSQQKEKAAFLFEQPETVQSLIDLFSTSGASQLEVSGNKITALIKEPGDTNRSPAQVSAILELLDRFARLLEFIAEEHHAAEN